MNEKIKLRRIVAEIPEGIVKEVKMLAARRNCTIKKWLMRAIVEAIQKETRFDKE